MVWKWNWIELDWIELKGFSRRWRLSLLNGLSWWWLLEGLSHLRCLSVLFAKVKSVSSAKLFHSRSIYGMETCCLIVNIQVSVSDICFARGDVLLSLVGIVLCYPVMPVQKESCISSPQKKSSKVVQSTFRSFLILDWQWFSGRTGNSLAQGTQKNSWFFSSRQNPEFRKTP